MVGRGGRGRTSIAACLPIRVRVRGVLLRVCVRVCAVLRGFGLRVPARTHARLTVALGHLHGVRPGLRLLLGRLVLRVEQKLEVIAVAVHCCGGG